MMDGGALVSTQIDPTSPCAALPSTHSSWHSMTACATASLPPTLRVTARAGSVAPCSSRPRGTPCLSLGCNSTPWCPTRLTSGVPLMTRCGWRRGIRQG
uniref:Uncharacterized protein n=1 Tax=Arundo donax TaxID=35708 RepID=A0A0A9B043_ARUDO